MTTLLLSPSYGKSFSTSVKAFYEEVEAHPSAQFETVRLTQLTHYKRKNAIAHEFLVLQLLVHGQTIQLRMERCRGSSLSFINVFQSSTFKANDLVSRELGVDEASHHIISRIRWLADAVVTLFDICTILRFMSEHSPDYRLLSKQCYWFCSMFIHRLRTLPNSESTMIQEASYKIRGKFAQMLPVLSDQSVEKDIEDFMKAEEAEKAARKQREFERTTELLNEVRKRGNTQATQRAQAADVRRPISPSCEKVMRPGNSASASQSGGGLQHDTAELTKQWVLQIVRPPSQGEL